MNATDTTANAYPTKQIDHAAYPKRCRRLSDAELLFIIHDCQSTLAAWPDQPNHGYYADEICYAADELYRRRKGGQRDTRPVSDCGGFRLADDHDHDAIVLEAIDTVLDLDDAPTAADVAAHYAAAGQPMDAAERAQLDNMTAAELADQLTYLADYQG
jgi:hypothetical protein